MSVTALTNCIISKDSACCSQVMPVVNVAASSKIDFEIGSSLEDVGMTNRLLQYQFPHQEGCVVMFMKIMAAIDGSDTSMEALMEARNLAVSRHATLRIVYAVADSDESDQSVGLRLLENAKSVVGDGLNVDTRILQAEVEYGLNGIAEAIAGAANEWKADLVVVGTANRRGLERFVIGSVAEQLIAKVDASVLLVRPRRSAD